MSDFPTHIPAPRLTVTPTRDGHTAILSDAAGNLPDIDLSLWIKAGIQIEVGKEPGAPPSATVVIPCVGGANVVGA